MRRDGASRRELLRPVALLLRVDLAARRQCEVAFDDCLEMVLLSVVSAVDLVRPVAAEDFDIARHVQRREGGIVCRVDLDGPLIVGGLRPRSGRRRRGGVPFAVRCRETAVEENIVGRGRRDASGPVGSHGCKSVRRRDPDVVARRHDKVDDRHLRRTGLGIDAIETGRKRKRNGLVLRCRRIKQWHHLDVNRGGTRRDRRRAGERRVGLPGRSGSANRVGDHEVVRRVGTRNAEHAGDEPVFVCIGNLRD